MAYKIYLQDGNIIVKSENHDAPNKAAALWKRWRKGKKYTGKPVALVVERQGEIVLTHRFDVASNQAGYVPLDTDLASIFLGLRSGRPSKTYAEDNDTLVARILKLSNWTQAELAAYLKVDQRTVGRYATGEIEMGGPAKSIAETLLQELEASMKRIFDGDSESAPKPDELVLIEKKHEKGEPYRQIVSAILHSKEPGHPVFMKDTFHGTLFPLCKGDIIRPMP